MIEYLKKINKKALSNDVVAWIPYDSSHNVVSYFTNEQWHMILETIHDEDGFRLYLDELKDVTASFMLKDVKRDTFIAFCLINFIDWNRNIVCFHGGGWATDLSASRKYLQGVKLILRVLISCGLKVRTECGVENSRSERFIKAMGFKCYRHDNERIYFYLPRNFKSVIDI